MCRIIEPGHTFYRYNIDNPPSLWDSSFHNVEYVYPELGLKNQIGALFFYDNREHAIQTGLCALDRWNNNHGDKQKNELFITTTRNTKELRLLDISDFPNITSILLYLRALGIDVLTDDFYLYMDSKNYQEPMSKIKPDFDKFCQLYDNTVVEGL